MAAGSKKERTLLIFSSDTESSPDQGQTPNTHTDTPTDTHAHTHIMLSQVEQTTVYNMRKGYDLAFNMIYCLIRLTEFISVETIGDNRR